MPRPRLATSCLVAFCVLFLGSTLFAQPLTERLPDSTLLYYNWSPDDSVSRTAAGGMLADAHIRDPLLGILRRTLDEFPGKLDLSGTELTQLLPDIVQCQATLAVLDIAPQKRGLRAKALFVVELGDRRAEFEQRFKPVQERLRTRYGSKLQMMKLGDSFLWVGPDAQDHPAFTWGFAGDRFIAYWGADAEMMLKIIAGENQHPRPLSADPTFKAAWEAIPGPSVLGTYANGQRLLVAMQELLVKPPRSMWHGIAPTWDGFLREVGVENLAAIIEKTTISEGQFLTRGRIITSRGPTGLLSALIQPAVDRETLQAIPGDAMFAVAGRVDLSRLYAQVKQSAGTLWDRDTNNLFEEFEQTAQGLGIPVDDLFATIGDQWVVYNAPSTGGFIITGWTLVGQLRDPDRAHRVEETLRRLIAQQLGGNPRAVQEYPAHGTTIHFMRQTGFLPASPAWALKDGRFIIALYPQIVEDALAQLGSDQSILDHPEFTDTWKQTEATGPLVYGSQRQIIENVYPLALILFTAASSFDDDFPVKVLPSMQRVLRYTGPSMASLHQADDGYGWTMSQSNPLLSPIPMVSPNFWLGVALSAAFPRTDAHAQVYGASNMRQIGQGMLLYSNENKGQYPPDLQTVIATQDLGAQVLVSPFNPTDECVYLHYEGLDNTVSPEVVLVYDPAALELEDATNVLFGDGHVEWLTRDKFDHAIARSRQVEPRSAPAHLLP